MRRERILILDGDGLAAAGLRAALDEGGLDAVVARSVDDVLAIAPALGPGAVLADAAMVGAGAGLVERLRALPCDAAVVVATAHDRPEPAAAALRAGAEGWLVRPLDPGKVRVVLEKALARRALRREHAALRERARAEARVVGADPRLVEVLDVLRRAAPTKAPVLVRGEEGVGKAHLAAALHEASPRRDRPFVRFGCAGLSEQLQESALFGHERGALPEADARSAGALERADGGTLYVADVDRLPPTLQIKLLRVIQHGELERIGASAPLRVDVRVVAGTRRDLAEEVRAGRFRDDLYYRLDVVSMTLPPLRERKGDLPALAAHLVARHAAALGRAVAGATPGALSALFSYPWPGNVAELDAVIAAAVARAEGKELAPEDLSHALQGARAEEGVASALIPGATLFEIEREAILRTLDQVNGSTARAAEILGVSIRKIQYRLKEYKAGATGRRRTAEEALGHTVRERAAG